jgi:signal-transduction protein with cAMP-binding, CBS, and nucleotidyltransferase domain
MKCRNVMNVEPEWISSGATVLEAAQVMRDRSVGMLLVFDPSPGHLKGVVTDRDLATRVCADDKRPAQTLVSDIATTDVVTCQADDDLRDAEDRMQRAEKSRLVVLQDGEAVGVVSLTDLFRYESHRRAVRTARAVLARDARGRSTPPERIKLTPSTPEDEAAAARQPSVMVGGTRTDTMKVFPT